MAAAGGGCARLAFVPRPPWVEDRTLSLDRERLVLAVGDDAVDVDAWFDFVRRAPADDRVMTFPVGGPRPGAERFGATWIGPDQQETVLPVRKGAPGPLPAAGAIEQYDIFIPAENFARGGWLRVRYRQRGAGPFGYVLETGSYWAGPIRELEVRVDDPAGRVRMASVEGDRRARGAHETLRFRFAEIEPRELVWLDIDWLAGGKLWTGGSERQ